MPLWVNKGFSKKIYIKNIHHTNGLSNQLWLHSADNTAEICFRTNLFAVYKCKLLGVVDHMRKSFPNDTFKRIPWERI